MSKRSRSFTFFKNVNHNKFIVFTQRLTKLLDNNSNVVSHSSTSIPINSSSLKSPIARSASKISGSIEEVESSNDFSLTLVTPKYGDRFRGRRDARPIWMPAIPVALVMPAVIVDGGGGIGC